MSEVKDDSNMIDAGTLRPSQLITNFGPGSIVHMRKDAVMIYGCHAWPNKNIHKVYKILHHHLLEKKLNMKSFRMPLSQDRAKNLPCFSFPRWGVCKRCQRMQHHESIPIDKNGFSCWKCEKDHIKSKDCELEAAKFVIICPKGHIDEFPWDEWVHFDRDTKIVKKCEKNPNNPQLNFGNDQKSSALKAFGVLCTSCGKYRNFSGATERSALKEMGITCTGKSPWIGPGESPCFDKYGNEQEVRGIQTRAGSLWYSINTSAIKVPKWLHPVNIQLEDEKNGEELRGAINTGRKGNQSWEIIWTFIESQLTDVKKQVLEQRKRDGVPYSDEDVKSEIIEKLDEIFSDTIDEEIPNQIDILNQEFDDLMKYEDTTGAYFENDFQLRTSEIDKNKTIFKYLETVKLVNRITTITALTGFTRDKFPDLINDDNDAKCYIASQAHRETEQWLPGVQSKGEGIFISLNEEEFSKLRTNEKLMKRCKAIIKSFAIHTAPNDEKKQKKIKDMFDEKFILLHTLSHLIIKSVVKEAGYEEPSLKERIYWDEKNRNGKNRNGILIYAAGSSEGSLGGLVRLGQSKLFERVLKNAVDKSQYCSRDPICGDADPERESASTQGGKAHQINGSSCHSCCFVSETSCEYFNQLLDRWVVNNPDEGFFKDFLNE